MWWSLESHNGIFNPEALDSLLPNFSQRMAKRIEISERKRKTCLLVDKMPCGESGCNCVINDDYLDIT